MDYKTPKGFELLDCSSALQKAIRRGNEDEAMYWSLELWNAGFEEYVWRRLKIIASEDIGLADSQAAILVQSLYQSYLQTKKKASKHGTPRIYMSHAVMYMARAPKSRLLDWAGKYYNQTHNEDEREVPDWAFDKHTRRGRTMGRGWKHFYTEGAKLHPHEDLPGEQEFREKCYKLDMGDEKEIPQGNLFFEGD